VFKWERAGESEYVQKNFDPKYPKEFVVFILLSTIFMGLVSVIVGFGFICCSL